ncbi:linear amide C-N hydrolase [Roseococcus sp. DSY-14]|uniref:linear amide C-N hydrolase n=1 Tax=Roseococcus sp. DSY-14 TaxID=3369650 RepID=UPI00387AA231
MTFPIGRRLALGAGAALPLLAIAPRQAQACSRALWNWPGLGVFIGRNMDWFEDTESNAWILPRGMERDGGAAVNPLRWTSRYGSTVLTVYDNTMVDGVNEAGLAGHLLYLPEASTGPRDPAKPGLSIGQWLTWYLDTCATVAEAVERTRAEPFQIRMAVEPNSGKPGTIHLALNDRSGGSAILECVNGRISVYHDRRYVVMTNQPTYDKQLENLRRFQGFGGTDPLPGTHEAADRFVRAAYYVTHLPTPRSQREAVAAIMSVMRNVSAPFGVADPARPNISTTIWRSVISLEQRTMYFDGVYSANVFWMNFGQFDHAPAAGVRKLAIAGNYDLTGDVSNRFAPAAMFRPLPSNE